MFTPFTRPISTPVSTPPITPTQTGRPMLVTNTPVITAQSAMPVPIERSMPPVMMTKVVPRARMPMTAVERRTVAMLLKVKKFGLAIVKKITRTMRVPNASDCWSWRLRNAPTSRLSVSSFTAVWMIVVVDDPGCCGVLISLPPRGLRVA